MNYQKIHDDIINRACQRTLCQSIYTEKHHIIPKCEGGTESGKTVKLTRKEHRLIHLLRYKITKVEGNLIACSFMKNTDNSFKLLRHLYAKFGAKQYHENYKINYPEKYSENQRNAGISGGNKCKEFSIGFFNLSEEEKQKSRLKGIKTVVENKLGMFSDEYREKHKIMLHKKIKTPEGIFNSMMEAANYYNVVAGTITYRVKSKNWNEWYYINQKGDCNE